MTVGTLRKAWRFERNERAVRALVAGRWVGVRHIHRLIVFLISSNLERDGNAGGSAVDVSSKSRGIFPGEAVDFVNVLTDEESTVCVGKLARLDAGDRHPTLLHVIEGEACLVAHVSFA